MESEKSAETLKEGFLMSKPRQNDIFCGKIREDGNPGCSSEATRDELSNVGLEREFGDGNVEESMVVDAVVGDNRVNEGSVNDYPYEKLPSSMVHDDFPVLEGGFENDEDQTAKIEASVGEFDDYFHGYEFVKNEEIEEPVEKCNDVFHPHEPGSPTKIEVSGNSINLFVDVFGSLDGISGRECMLGENNFKQESSLEGNETLSTGIKDLSVKYEGEHIIGEQEYTFDIGDLVWVKTRTQLWWPGMVSDPSSAPNDTARCEKKDSYLVKYYGNASLVWCENADLKPFPEYYEQMAGQNNSRNFYGSVDRALCELGQRVKLKMTCPCFSKDNEILDAQLSVRNKEENFVSTQKASKFDVLSLSQFQPAAFIADIRDLARSMRVPSKIDLIVMKNRLVPFYRAIGHRELPLQLLRSGSDSSQNTPERLTSGTRDENHNDPKNAVEARDGISTGIRKKKRKGKNQSDGSGIVLDDKLTSSPKGLESRERKKSKYLSYPYVDVKKEQENDDIKEGSNLEGSCSDMDKLKRVTKKPSKGHHIVSKEDDINACSVDLLAELCYSARDCFYISRSKYSDTLKRFYCSFRMFAFLDPEIASKVDEDQPALNLEKCLQGSAEAEVRTEGSAVMKKPQKQKASVKKNVENDVVGEGSSAAGNPKAKEKATGKRSKKKEAKTSEVQLEGIKVVKESENEGVNLASNSSENTDKFPNTDNLQAKENGVSLKTSNQKEKAVPAGVEFLQSPFSMGAYPFHTAGLESAQSSLSMGAHAFLTSSWMISFQQAYYAGLFKTPQKSAGLTPGLADTSSIPRIPDLNGNLPAFLVDHMPVGERSTNPVNPLPEPKKERVIPPTINGVPKMDFGFASSSSKDVPVTVQKTPLSNNGATGLSQCINGGFTARALDPTKMSAGVSPSARPPLQMASFLSSCKPELKKRKRKEKNCEVASVIPDLNGNLVDINVMSPPGMPVNGNVVDMNMMSPPGMPTKGNVVDMNMMSPPGMPKNGNVVDMNMMSPPGMPMNGNVLLMNLMSPPGMPMNGNAVDVNLMSPPGMPPKGNVVDMNMMSPPGMPVNGKVADMNLMSPPGMPMNGNVVDMNLMSPPGMPMNGNGVDINLMSPPGMPKPEGSHVPPEAEPIKKRRYRSSTSGESDPPGNLLLKFAPGCVPPKETLVATFSRFGLLKESELEFSTDDCVKIPYERRSDARFAFRSMEKGHAFGESLLGFNLDSCSMPEPPKIKRKKNSNNVPLHTFVPCKNKSKPDIAFIKQNVEMMKSTLEKAGDSLSPETRAKLEKEIKAFLDKISSLSGSSS